MFKIFVAALLSAFSVSSFAQPSGHASSSTFTLGADISWYSEMADNGYSFADGNTQMSCPELVRAYGLQAVRLRVWVNPTNAYNACADVVKKARAAKAAGLDVLIDFHLSDTWADPGKQTIPSAWKDDSYDQLKAHLRAHIVEVLTALKAEGVEPRWVQVGNETNNGLLWGMGTASETPKQYATLVAEGASAVKSVCPDAAVIVHVSNGYDQGLFDWNIGILHDNRVPFDIIGMSLYPGNDETTGETVAKTMDNIRHLRTAFGKPVMIVEVGLPVNSGDDGKSRMADILKRAATQTDGACVGVFYWEPEAPSGWNHYQLGAATVTNKVVRFTAVMDAFREMSQTTDIAPLLRPTHCLRSPRAAYSLQGYPLAAPVKGLHVVDRHTVYSR